MKTQASDDVGNPKIGILLIHGFASAPGIWHEMRHVLVREGFEVSVPSLAGHGKELKQLAEVHWSDWIVSIQNAYQELRSKVSEVFVIGHSLGATLALYCGAALAPPDGLVLMSPSVEFSWQNRLMLSVVGLFVKSVPIKGFKANRQDLERTPELGASAMPISAVRTNLEFKGVVRELLPAVRCPVFILVGDQDRFIPRGSAEYIMNRISSVDKEVFILENSQHAIPLDLDREIAFKLSVDFVRKISETITIEAI